MSNPQSQVREFSAPCIPAGNPPEITRYPDHAWLSARPWSYGGLQRFQLNCACLTSRILRKWNGKGKGKGGYYTQPLLGTAFFLSFPQSMVNCPAVELNIVAALAKRFCLFAVGNDS